MLEARELIALAEEKQLQLAGLPITAVWDERFPTAIERVYRTKELSGDVKHI
jgi:hypothetical protein